LFSFEYWENEHEKNKVGNPASSCIAGRAYVPKMLFYPLLKKKKGVNNGK